MKYTVCLKILITIDTKNIDEIVEKYGEKLYWIADEEGNVVWLNDGEKDIP